MTMKSIRKQNIFTEEEGSFTIEASLVFPILFALTILFLMMSLYLFQQASYYVSATTAAERAAFNWDNSYKNPVTGTYAGNQYDGLYWRTFDDSGSDIFGFLIPNQPSQVTVSSGQLVNGQLNELPSKKLAKVTHYLPDNSEAVLQYVNHFINRNVTVKLDGVVRVPDIIKTWMSGNVHVEASSKVTEPVEFIRNVDLIRTYLPILQQHSSKLLSRIKKNTNSETQTQQPAGFASEPEARQHMQQMVNGKQTSKTLPDGKRRQIDALDRDRVAHQAYLGYIPNRKVADENGDRFNEQLSKDLELLRQNEVKAIVWHFFRSSKTGKVGPSKPLLRELERNGIIVMIHNE